MALADGVSFSAASSGTGTFVFSAARSSFLTLAQAVTAGLLVDGQTVSYLAQDSLSPTQREWGHGTFSAGGNSIARTTPLVAVSSGTVTTGTALSFSVAPYVSLTLLAEDLSLTLAGANLVWYVNPSTGSDSNAGTSGSPFKTIQHAVNVASGYNYQNLYAPTIDLVAGTYSEQVTLPTLCNCPAGGTLSVASGVTINDTGTAYTITASPNSYWTMSGSVPTFSGTFGGLQVENNAYLACAGATFAGTFSAYCINNNGGYFNGYGGAFNTTMASAFGFVFSRGLSLFDTATITFTNTVTFGQYVVGCDDQFGGFYFYQGTFTNASKVTCTNPLSLTNFSFFEGGFGGTNEPKVDGVALSRANFPGVSNGGSVIIDPWSVFEPDLYVSGIISLGNYTPADTLTNVIAMAPEGSLVFDYNISNAGEFTLQPSGGFCVVQANNSTVVGFNFDNTAAGAHNWGMGAVGANLGVAGFFGFYDFTESFAAPLGMGADVVSGFTNVVSLSPTTAFYWDASGITAGTPDTILTRASAGVLAVGTASGSLTGGTVQAAKLLSPSATGGVGYATGAGGTVTQATSKSTGVTLNKASGHITLNAASLGSATIVTFTLTNTNIAATDYLVLNHVSAGTAGAYTLNAQCAAGSATINVRNATAGALAEAIVIGFALIKGATS